MSRGSQLQVNDICHISCSMLVQRRSVVSVLSVGKTRTSFPFLKFLKHPANQQKMQSSLLILGEVKILFPSFHFRRHLADQKMCVTCMPYRQIGMPKENYLGTGLIVLKYEHVYCVYIYIERETERERCTSIGICVCV